MEENPLEEMARLADLTVRVKRFLAYNVAAYGFYVYALGVIAFLFVSTGIAGIAGWDEGEAGAIGSIIGVITASYVFGLVIQGVEGFNNRGGGRETRRRSALLFILLFTSVFTVALAVSTLFPGAVEIGWYPGVATMLLILYAFNRKEVMKPHLYASLFMLATSPVVLIYKSFFLAIGLMALSYFLAGSYMTIKALRELGG